MSISIGKRFSGRASAIRLEGGLIGPEIVEGLLRGELSGQQPEDFGFKGNSVFLNDIATSFSEARLLWQIFMSRRQRVADDERSLLALTQDGWMSPFLSLLGYRLHRQLRSQLVGETDFFISHRADESEEAPPVHIVSVGQELGRVDPQGKPRYSPHVTLQEYLNRTEHVWGIVTNGHVIRLLRNSTYIRRQSYIEFDLRLILEEERFEAFQVLHRLLHRTRLPHSWAMAAKCHLEAYYEASRMQGGRVRERLRDSVEKALVSLANGFLDHPRNTPLRSRLQAALSSEPSSEALSPMAFYQELLRLVYRFLFISVADSRGLMSQHPLYRLPYGYGLARLRRLVDQRTARTDRTDLWHGLRMLWRLLADERLGRMIQLPPLNGDLFRPQMLDNCILTNSDLLEAFWHLTYFWEAEGKGLRRISYAALDVEELGSVYESLLEYRPQVTMEGQRLVFRLEAGSERKSTGSYYTPHAMVVELARQTLDPVIEERLSALTPRPLSQRERGDSPHPQPLSQRERGAERAEAALLSIRVLDPACGSGHFLLEAARRIGRALARVRTGEENPAPEAFRQAVREVITHCLYGVDKNPLSVELCRVALWIEGHQAGKPLTFLAHRIQCGDSLVGVCDPQAPSAGLPDQAFQPVGEDDKNLSAQLKKRNRQERQSRVPPLFSGSADLKPLSDITRTIETRADETLSDVEQKRQTYEHFQTNPTYQHARQHCDLYTAAFFQELKPGGAFITTGTLYQHRQGHQPPQELALAEAIAIQQRFFHWVLAFPEVFEQGGFDVVLGNPPFMGGLKVSGALGAAYRRYLEAAYEPYGGTADLCAVFVRRGYQLLRPGGRLGFVATNTIGQGDTRESGLAHILRQGGRLIFAKRFLKWPGAASVEVHLLALYKPPTAASPPIQPRLDDRPVPFLSSRLDDQPEMEPQTLVKNKGKSFQGSIVLGMGFVLEPKEAQRLLDKDPRHADCLFPYLNGEDLNSHPEQKPSRWVICFHDWSLEKAKEYPDLIEIVEQKVKPEREKLKDTISIQAKRKQFWWQYGSPASQLYHAIQPLTRVLARALTSEFHMMAFVPKGYIFSHALGIFAFDDSYHFAILQSGVHEVWIRQRASSLGTTLRYTPTDCFENFPFPERAYELWGMRGWSVEELTGSHGEAARIGAAYEAHRREVMQARRIGLTKVYNLFHNPGCRDEDIEKMRAWHAEMDRAVAACYGWADLELGHGFYENERGQKRYGIAEGARRELIRRLLELNARG